MSNTTPINNAARDAGQNNAERLNKLVCLFAAGETLLEFWAFSTPVHPGSDAAEDFKEAMNEARKIIYGPSES